MEIGKTKVCQASKIPAHSHGDYKYKGNQPEEMNSS